jgi:hypothetical protein
MIQRSHLQAPLIHYMYGRLVTHLQNAPKFVTWNVQFDQRKFHGVMNMHHMDHFLN